MKPLIKFELQKILKRKFTVFILIAVSVLNIIFIFSLIKSQIFIENSTEYSGFEAIEKDKKTADQFSGILTDDTIKKIISKYGRSDLNTDGESYNYNSANSFVTYEFLEELDFDPTNNIQNLSIPEYIDQVKNVSQVFPYSSAVDPVIYGYSYGWKTLHSLFQMMSLLTVIVVITALTPVFTEEYSRETDTLIMTSRYGRTKILTAKICASLIFTLSLYVVMIAFNYLCIGFSFGFDGLDISIQSVNNMSQYPMIMSWKSYLGNDLIFIFAGFLSVSGITMLFSSMFRSSLNSIFSSASVTFIPVFIYSALSPSSSLNIPLSYTPIVGIMNGNFFYCFNEKPYMYVILFVIFLTVCYAAFILLSSQIFKNISTDGTIIKRRVHK